MNRVLWAYKVAVKSGTQFSPFHLVYGKEAIMPLDVEIPALKFLVEEGYEPVDCYREIISLVDSSVGQRFSF